MRQSEQGWKGYESCHDSSGHSESKGSTEDAQEDAKGFQQGHGLKAVAVVSSWLIGHNRAEDRIHANKCIMWNKEPTFIKNPIKGSG